MGGVPDNGEGPERVHTWGGKTDNRTATKERAGWEVVYPSLDGAMMEAGLTDVRTSINRRHNTVTQYIPMRPLLELCKGDMLRAPERVDRGGQ